MIAWNDAIKNDLLAGPMLVEALGSDKIDYLIDLTGHTDITMRTEATSLLSKLLVSTANVKQGSKDSTTKSNEFDSRGTNEIERDAGNIASLNDGLSSGTNTWYSGSETKLWTAYLNSLTKPGTKNVGKPNFLSNTEIMAYNELVALDKVACRLPSNVNGQSLVNILDGVDWNSRGASNSSIELANEAKSKVGSACENRQSVNVH